MDHKLKRAMLFTAAGGAGAVLALALLVAGQSWYSTRPKPWNTGAIKAEFQGFDTEGEKNTLVLEYYLENRSDADYQIPDQVEVSLMGKRAKDGALLQPEPTWIGSIDPKVFIPAHQKVMVEIHFLVTPDIKKRDVSDKSHTDEEYLARLRAWVTKEYANCGGMVLFDKQNRYQINFPRGW